METGLTRAIKQATHTYKPKMPTDKRTIRWADEVWTPNGIVDSIRFEDYIVSRHEECGLIEFGHHDNAGYQAMPIQGHTPGECKVKGEAFPNPNCHGCIYRKRGVPVIGMMVTAYEVKITKSDFLSGNGHNIDDPGNPIGNGNYYCMPKDLVAQVEDMVPGHVGILTWTGWRLRMYRKARWLDVPDDVKVKLLYNALKKWVDHTPAAG